MISQSALDAADRMLAQPGADADSLSAADRMLGPEPSRGDRKSVV